MDQRPICQLCCKNPVKQKGYRRGKMRYGILCSGCYKRRLKIHGPHPSYKVYTDDERQALRARRHKKNPYRRYLHDTCDWCGFVPVFLGQLDIHHKDGNHNNNSPLNLATLCSNCHRLAHYQIRSGIR